jgi:replication initiation and membrane attachment protein
MMEQHWKEVLPVDRYIVRSHQILHDYDRKIITLLYQPLIGSKSFSLYMTFWSELEQNRLWGEEATHHSLIAIMQCNLKDIYQARLKLEGLGLLKTFLREEEDKRLFIYELHPPLTPQQFFTDSVLSVFLYNRVGRTKFNKLKRFFSDFDFDRNQFREMTKPFNEVFSTVHPEELVLKTEHGSNSDLELSSSHVYMDRTDSRHLYLSDSVFNFNLFLSGLSENIVPRKAITPKVKEAIKKLAFLYGLDPLQMQKVVMSAINEENIIDIEELRKAAREWYQFEHGNRLPKISELVQPMEFRTMNDDEPKTKEEQLIKLLETISPKQLLMDISGGIVPSSADLQVIEDIMFQQKLLPGVVNVLIYYVMLRTDMKLSKAYMEKIASHWARKNIKTVKEAMDLAKKEHRQYQNWAQSKKQRSTQHKVVRKELLPDWLHQDQPEETLSEEEQAQFEMEKRKVEEILKHYRKNREPGKVTE